MAVNRFVADVPLRIKLIASVLALVTVALLVIGVASALVMRKSLVDRVDDQLRDWPAQLHAALPYVARGDTAIVPFPSNLLLAVGNHSTIDPPRSNKPKGPL